MKLCYRLCEMREERIGDRGYRKLFSVNRFMVGEFFLLLLIMRVWRGSECLPLSHIKL